MMPHGDEHVESRDWWAIVTDMTGADADPLEFATWGANFTRLQRLKTRYDPANLFHVNQNIKPLTEETKEVS